MNLLPADLGRPIGDLTANVDVRDLEALIAEVIDEVQPREREVRDREGRRYALRVHPYRTGDNKIDGAVLVLLDIEDLKRSQEEASEARDYAEAIVATVREPLIILDGELRVVTANVASTGRSESNRQKRKSASSMSWANSSGTFPRCADCWKRSYPERRPSRTWRFSMTFPRSVRKPCSSTPAGCTERTARR
jgi:two-component system, chemotaxis family, CheB/CheR fusion protein